METLKKIGLRIFQILVFTLSLGSLKHPSHQEINWSAFRGLLFMIIVEAITAWEIYFIVRYFTAGAFWSPIIAFIPGSGLIFLAARMFGRGLGEFEGAYVRKGNNKDDFLIFFQLIIQVLVILFGLYAFLQNVVGFFSWIARVFPAYWPWFVLGLALLVSLIYRRTLFFRFSSINSVTQIMDWLSEIERSKKEKFRKIVWQRLIRSNEPELLGLVFTDIILPSLKFPFGNQIDPLLIKVTERFIFLLPQSAYAQASLRPLFVTQGSYNQKTEQLLSFLAWRIDDGNSEQKFQTIRLLEITLNFLGYPQDGGKSLDMLKVFDGNSEFISHEIFKAHLEETETRKKTARDREIKESETLHQEAAKGSPRAFIRLYMKVGLQLLENKNLLMSFYHGAMNMILWKNEQVFFYSSTKRKAIWATELDSFFIASLNLYNRSFDDELLAQIRDTCQKILAHIKGYASPESNTLNKRDVETLVSNKTEFLAVMWPE